MDGALLFPADGCRTVDVCASWFGDGARAGRRRAALLSALGVVAACALLIVANVFNIGADLGGMAEVTEMMTGIQSYYWTPLYTILIISLLFFASYRQIARIFKWLTLVLFAYIAAAFLARPEWHSVLSATFVPRLEWSNAFLATFVGILGTTISPYLFFWQASQEVEALCANVSETLPPFEFRVYD